VSPLMSSLPVSSSCTFSGSAIGVSWLQAGRQHSANALAKQMLSSRHKERTLADMTYCPTAAAPVASCSGGRTAQPLVLASAARRRIIYTQGSRNSVCGLRRPSVVGAARFGPAARQVGHPGGFLEQGERLAEGAARELREEAGILLLPEQMQLYMTGSITFINQVYMDFARR